MEEIKKKGRIHGYLSRVRVGRGSDKRRLIMPLGKSIIAIMARKRRKIKKKENV